MSVGCAMRTINQQLACSFRCARRTLHWFIELIRASLAIQAAAERQCQRIGQKNPLVCPTAGAPEATDRSGGSTDVTGGEPWWGCTRKWAIRLNLKLSLTERKKPKMTSMASCFVAPLFKVRHYTALEFKEILILPIYWSIIIV